MYLCLFVNIISANGSPILECSCLHQTKPKKTNQKKTKLDREFLVWSSKMCFLVFLEFFVFWFGNRTTKKKRVFLFVFLYLMEVKKVQKTKKNTRFFLVVHQTLCPKPNLKFEKSKKKLLCFFCFFWTFFTSIRYKKNKKHKVFFCSSISKPKELKENKTKNIFELQTKNSLSSSVFFFFV